MTNERYGAREARSGELLRRAARVWLAICVLAVTAAAQSLGVTGVVRDRAGAPVSGATVVFVAAGAEVTAVTDDEGRFSLPAASRDGGRLVTTATGFSRDEIEVDPTRGEIEILLDLAPFTEEVTVTASRVERRVGETASSVVVLSGREIEKTAAVSLDGVLRQVPGFSLFRRTDSRVANPTTQGASLRGLAPSGASRVAVLVDGVPVNDPFGGWVYWSRVPREAIGRVEVVRGGASSLYGTDALGGVVNVLTSEARDRVALELSGGTHETGLASLFASMARDAWRVSLAAEAFHTDGYVLVDEDERGPVDTPAGSRHATLDLRLERALGDAGRVFARAAYFAEERDNGTPLQTNQTRIRDAAVGLDWRSDRYGSARVRLYGGTQGYDQSFSAVSDDRASETLVRLQYVPSQQTGLSAQWAHAPVGWLALVAGVDAREVRGRSVETGFFGGRATSASEAGGRQRTVGVFGEGIARAGEHVTISAGARYDRWRNFAASAASRPLGPFGSPSLRELDDREESAFSPRLAVVYRVAPSVSLRLAGYRSFRAPTLNELYRGFRVGDVVTLANERLRAERLTGAEAGASVATLDGRLALRGTFYWSEVTRPVANVTLAVTPDLITRQRENLGRVRARGVEVDVEARPTRWLTLTGGYVFAASTIARFEANPAIEGLRVPQVPRHHASVQALVLAPSRVTLGLQARVVGAQFDDDRNTLALGSFGVVDLVASRPIARGVELFGAVENLFDTRFEVGKTPVTTVGAPFGARFGARVRR